MMLSNVGSLKSAPKAGSKEYTAALNLLNALGGSKDNRKILEEGVQIAKHNEAVLEMAKKALDDLEKKKKEVAQAESEWDKKYSRESQSIASLENSLQAKSKKLGDDRQHFDKEYAKALANLKDFESSLNDKESELTEWGHVLKKGQEDLKSEMAEVEKSKASNEAFRNKLEAMRNRVLAAVNSW